MSTDASHQATPAVPAIPHAKKVGKLRSAMLNAVTEAELTAVIKKLVELAKSGNVPAAKEVLDRWCTSHGSSGHESAHPPCIA